MLVCFWLTAGLCTSNDEVVKDQRLCSLKQQCSKSQSLPLCKRDNESTRSVKKKSCTWVLVFAFRGGRVHVCVWFHLYVCVGEVCPNAAVASQFSPVYIPCLLCSSLHLPRAVLAASRLAAFQTEQLPILVCFNAHRHRHTHTHTHIPYIHTHTHTRFENDP